jgi:hypothetical protein
LLIVIRIFTSKLKIAVRNPNLVTDRLKQVKHHHRINSATYGKQNPLRTLTEFFLVDMFEKGFAHKAKLNQDSSDFPLDCINSTRA